MFDRSIPALVRSAAVLGVVSTTITMVRAADTWTDWQPLPDRYQGKIAFRLQTGGKKSGFRYQLRNGYDQKVTVKFAVAGKDASGAPLKDERSITLEPGEQPLKGDDQKLSYTDLTSVALADVQFTGAAPPPTLGGFYAPSIEIAALQKAIVTAQKHADEAEAAEKEADSNYASVHAAANAPGGVSNRKTGDGDDLSTAGQISGVQAAESVVKQAAELNTQAHKAVTKLKNQLSDALAADDDAKKAGEKRLAAVLSGASNGTTQAAPTVPVATTTGTTSTGTTSTAPATATATAPAVPFVKPTLTEAQMKTYYKQGSDAFNKKDWPGVEAALAPLLAGSGDSIKPADRAGVYYRLGTAYDNDNKPAEAEAAYTQAVTLGLKDDSLENDLATVQYSQGKTADAEKSERAAIALKKDNSSYFFNLGLICMAQKKYKDAEDAYKSALKLDPDNDQIKKHLKDAQDAEKAAAGA